MVSCGVQSPMRWSRWSRAFGLFEIHLPSCAERAVAVGACFLFQKKARCAVAFFGDGDGRSQACNAGTRDDDVVFAVPGTLCPGIIRAFAARGTADDSKRRGACERDACSFEEGTTRGLDVGVTAAPAVV